MLEFGDPVDQKAAVLHDVVEDTDCQIRDLVDRWFPHRCRYGNRLSDTSTHEAYADYSERRSANDVARRVKVIDLRHNRANNRRLPESSETAERPAEPGGRPGSWYQRDLAVWFRSLANDGQEQAGHMAQEKLPCPGTPESCDSSQALWEWVSLNAAPWTGPSGGRERTASRSLGARPQIRPPGRFRSGSAGTPGQEPGSLQSNQTRRFVGGSSMLAFGHPISQAG